MGSAKHRTILSEQIAEILATRDRTPDAGDRAGARLSARKSIACGSMILLTINPGQVGAVGLGEIHLKSRLGQPLEAVVPVTLREGETLPKNCVQAGPRNQTLGAPPDMRVTSPARHGPGTYNIRVSTANPLHEPMYEVSLMIRCQGTPLLVRQYVLMLDLPGMPVPATAPMRETSTASATAANRRTNAARNDATGARRVTTNRANALPPRNDSIPAGSMYRVSSRDTLSTIALRVEGRLRNTTWQVADQIFADNPDAFIRNDPNMIKLGSLIRVPGENVLAAMTPGTSRSRAPAPAVRRQPVASARVVPDRATLPTRAPTAAVSRDEEATTRRTPDRVSEPASTRWPEPDSRETEAIGAASTDAEPLVATPEPAAETGPDFSSSFSPFADEQPAQTVVSPPDVMQDLTTTPVAATATEPAESGPSSSLLSILIGILVGTGLILLLLRGRLQEALGARRQRRPIDARRKDASSRTGTFNESIAAAAFDRTDGDLDEMTSLPIVSAPLEDTYIVETAPPEPTIQEDIGDLRAALQDADTAEQTPATQLDETVDDGGSPELANVFDNDDATLVSEPTAEMPKRVPESMEPTAEVPLPDQSVLEPTAEMPLNTDDEIFDPTAGLPIDALDDIFDPTGGVDGNDAVEIESSLMQAFDEGLDNVDPDEMFATSSHTVEQLTVELDATINDSPEDPLLDEATVAVEPGDLPLGEDGDDSLAETLQEALDLLERDYEDEFTASQVLERSTLEKSLQDDLEQTKAEPKGRNVKRKIS